MSLPMLLSLSCPELPILADMPIISRSLLSRLSTLARSLTFRILQSMPTMILLLVPLRLTVSLLIWLWRNDHMASYRQYRHSSSSDFGRPKPWNFELDPYARYELSKVPGIGDFYRAMDQKKYYTDYLTNRGMTWNDVKYPALLGGEGAFGAGMAAYRVSRNLFRLYK